MKFIISFQSMAIFLCCLLLFTACKKNDQEEELGTGDPVGPDRALPYEITDWMSRIDTNVYLSEITIPGTHDAGADLHTSKQGAASRSTICQHFRLENQLKLGVRWFDVRLCLDGSSLTVHHWKYYLHKNFDDLLIPAVAFVKQHKSEAVIFMIKQEHSDTSDHEFGVAVESKVSAYGMENFFIGNHVPKLSEVKGKIVIVKQFAYWDGHDFGMRFQWGDNTTGDSYTNDGVDIYVQDHYAMFGHDNSEKVDYIKACMVKSNQETNPEKFYVNFTSCEKRTEDLRHLSDDINPVIKGYLSLPSAKKNGVVLVNFAGGADDGGGAIQDPDLVKYIINTNLQMNRIRYFIGWNLDSQGIATNWTGPVIAPITQDIGYYTSDGGAAAADLNSNGIPDLILMVVTENDGPDSFRYVITYDINTSGNPSSWSDVVLPAGNPDIGYNTAGGGAAIVNLGQAGQHSLICMAIADNPGLNDFRFQPGVNLSNSGTSATWKPLLVPSSNLDIGWDNQGGGCDVTNLDSNPKPELIMMAVVNDQEMNDLRYVIGWNLNNDGVPDHYSGVYNLPTMPDIGWENAGGGLAITNIDTNPLPDLFMIALTDNLSNGPDNFRYIICWNMKSDGNPTTYSDIIMPSVPDVGYNTEGTGAAFADIDNNGRPDLILMKIDDPSY